MITRRLALAAAGAALLAGCASIAPPARVDTLSGRLAVRVAAHDGVEARSATAAFELSGNAERGELTLSSPLGTTWARARWQPGEAQVDTGRGVESHRSLDDLAERLFGERLPLSALVDWLRGRPWPGAPSVATADGFEQLGWRIDTSRRAEGQLLAERPAAPGVSVRARLDEPS